jgi:hypothetical protein
MLSHEKTKNRGSKVTPKIVHIFEDSKIHICTYKNVFIDIFRENYFHNLSLFKIVINIGVYLLYYIGYESIPSKTVDCESPYENIQKSTPLRIQ